MINYSKSNLDLANHANTLLKLKMIKFIFILLTRTHYFNMKLHFRNLMKGYFLREIIPYQLHHKITLILNP